MPNRAIVQAKRIKDIRSGLGSLTLPSEYIALQLHFSQYNANGHMGPRKFTQENLPRIQFHNPHLSINVKRVKGPDKKNTNVSAYLRILKSGQTEQQGHVIDIKGLHSTEIVKRLAEITGATEVVEQETVTA